MYEELIKRLRHSANFAERGLTPPPSELREAADIIEELSILAENGETTYDIMVRQTSYIEELQKKVPRWIPVTERLPKSGVHVLLACKTWGGNKYVCDGFHTEKFSQPTEFYEDIDADYSEETDEYYFPEGWWEVIKNWDDYSCVAIEDTITHWMPLPEPPMEGET